MIGQVGSDAFGTSLRDSLRAAGVDTSDGVSIRSTGSARISGLPDGEDAILDRRRERNLFPSLPSKGCV